jgi:hypothetical protein
MAKTIPQLTDATTVNAADELIIQQGGITKRATGAELAKGLNTINGTVNVKDFGAVGDGAADDTAAIQAAITAAAGKTLVLAGTFRVTGTLNVTASNTRIVGDGTAKIIASGASWTSGQPVLQIAGSGAGTATTLSAAITSSSTTFSVASASELSAGTFVTISSGSEYWSGITGDSGFQPVNKSELNRIRSVSGTTITPEWGLEDTYSISGHTVTVTPYTFIENVAVDGVQFYGLGNGNANTTSGVNPLAIKASFVNNLSIAGCRIENFQYSAADIVLCNSVRVTNNEIIGRDLSDSTNLPTISVWFYGVSFLGSTNWVFSNNTCHNLRRAVDANFTSGTTIPRHGTVSGNTAIACQNGYGTHFAEDIVFTGNVAADCETGLYIRGKNVVVANNLIRSVSATISAAGIMIGGDDATNYANNPSAGFVTVSNNHIQTVVQGIVIRVDVDAAVISGNIIRGCNSNAIVFSGKRTKDVIISDNHVDLTTRTADRRCVYFHNVAGRMLQLQNVSITGNRLANASEAIRIEGPENRANAAKNIVITANTINDTIGTMTRGIRLTSGYFGENIVFRDNIFGASVSVTPVTLDANAFYFNQAPDTGDNVFWNYNQQVIGFQANTTLITRLSAVVGQKILNSAPSAGEYIGWICTTSGTSGSIGTVAGGSVTGGISGGSNQLELAANPNNAVFEGAFITVAGAGAAAANLSARVTAVSGTTITLDTNAGTTVTGATVTYTAPVFKGFGAIQA